jgi:hypothetical protein
MKKAIRITLGSAVLAGGLAVVGASPANAQVRFEGSFPLPHGRISIGVGDPRFGVGSYVPYGYNVYDNPDYGYGFEYEDQWFPCEQYGSQWVIIGAPVFFGHRDYGYARPYRNYGYGYSRPYSNYGYSRPYGNYGYSRPYGNYGYSQPNRNYGYSQPNRSYGYSQPNRGNDSRSYRRDDQRRWNGRDSRRSDNRDSRRHDRGSRDQNRRPRW